VQLPPLPGQNQKQSSANSMAEGGATFMNIQVLIWTCK
jgi:hypothetical protein